MRILKALLLALLIASLFSSLSFAAQQDRISGSLASGERHVLKGNIRHQALPEYDQGRVDPGMQLGTMTLLTAPTPAQESAIKLLLAQQQDRKSPNYHKWITPEQYADRFGLSPNDIQQLVAWLSAQGFTMIEPAHGRNFITFTGTAARSRARSARKSTITTSRASCITPTPRLRRFPQPSQVSSSVCTDWTTSISKR